MRSSPWRLLGALLLLPASAIGFQPPLGRGNAVRGALRAAASWARHSRHARGAAAMSMTTTSRGAASSSSSGGVQVWEGLAALADRYDAFLIDQWGVMHDGHRAYPGAVECMAALVQAGKAVLLLSNSSKRRASSLQRLAEMGFSPETYTDCITSGELAYQGLLQPRTTDPAFSGIQGHRVLVFGNDDDDEEYVASLGCELAGVEEADFLLARGPFLVLDGSSTGSRKRYSSAAYPEHLHSSPEFRSIAQAAIRRGLPLVVSNPDVVRPGGSNDPMPGLLGQHYEEQGGRVVWVGKPHPLVYQHCRAVLQRAGRPVLEGARVCCVGDSMWNDIQGAHQEGFHSVLVADGIHADALGLGQGQGQTLDPGALEGFLQAFDFQPTHAVPRFRW